MMKVVGFFAFLFIHLHEDEYNRFLRMKKGSIDQPEPKQSRTPYCSRSAEVNPIVPYSYR